MRALHRRLLHVSLLLPLQLVDSIGVNDSAGVHRTRQRELEQSLPNLHVLTPSDLTTDGPLFKHLLKSPFLDQLVQEHLHPGTTTCQRKLTIVLFRYEDTLMGADST
jgi:hypothetical protein